MFSYFCIYWSEICHYKIEIEKFEIKKTIFLIWEEVIIIGVLLETLFHWRPSWTSRWKPTYSCWRPHIFIGDPIFSLETPIFSLETPYFHWRPHIFIGDPHIFIGNSQIIFLLVFKRFYPFFLIHAIQIYRSEISSDQTRIWWRKLRNICTDTAELCHISFLSLFNETCG